MIAQVIVDVAAKQTDRIFEYNIPKQISDLTIGARVVVPFGPRKVQGFVVGLTKTSQYQGKLKNLLLVVDEQAPLTPELVQLSEYLAKTILFSLKIGKSSASLVAGTNILRYFALMTLGSIVCKIEIR